jgi:hypothetical protein
VVGSNDRGVVSPLKVNFESVIHGEDSDEDEKDLVILKPKPVLSRGRMGSTGKLKE